MTTATAEAPARTVEIGSTVIAADYDRTYEYGGEADDPRFTQVRFSLGSGGLSVLRCAMGDTAPADTPIPDKDARVDVVKCERGYYPTHKGPWKLTLPSTGWDEATYHKTKRDATTEGLRRLAILDWHASKPAPAAGAAPEPAMVRLPHTGLQVPDRRLVVKSLQQIPTSDGVAFTAKLSVDNRPAGLIANGGYGGETTYQPFSSAVFGWRHMEEYAGLCRDQDGEPVTIEQLIEDLVTEHEVLVEVDKQLARRRVPLRRLEPLAVDGEVVVAHVTGGVFGVAEAGAVPASQVWRAALVRGIEAKRRSKPGEFYQVWTGEQWETLPTLAEANAA